MTVKLRERRETYFPALEKGKIPEHVAFIMDGNRRWARNRDLPVRFGYIKGAERLKEVIRSCMDLGVKTVTAFAFSTENKRRSPEEISVILHVLTHYLVSEREDMQKNGIRFETIGNIETFPKEVSEEIRLTKEMTKGGEVFTLILALNYGGRDEIVRAVTHILRDFRENKFSDADLSEELIGRYLDTASYSDPELLIRTSGEFRLSNFLLWQLSYTEISVVPTLWPDFDTGNLYRVIDEFQKREVRRGL